ncbi:MAG: type II toxin-antitoxin system HigB family toxin [Bacteroidetes bacterium]|jgi:mRNA interferase HigB|nr:MAG: type II toxin-antitoxin system HigB family toxin [Bacteroidota bacterium]
MKIITKRTLANAIEVHPEIKTSINLWIAKVKEANWERPNDVNNDFSKARTIKNNRIVFNINNNDYRLIVQVNYPAKIVYIKFIGTHSAYDKINPETVNNY